MKTSVRILATVSVCAILGSCSLFSSAFNRPAPESPVDSAETYLSVGDGPQSEVELGPGQQTLMEHFIQERAAKLELEQRTKELEASNQQMRAQLAQTEEDRNQARTHGAGAEAELERLRGLLRDHESKVLNLTLEKARLEQEVLKLRIASLQGQLERIGGNAEGAAPPARPR